MIRVSVKRPIDSRVVAIGPGGKETVIKDWNHKKGTK